MERAWSPTKLVKGPNSNGAHGKQFAAVICWAELSQQAVNVRPNTLYTTWEGTNYFSHKYWNFTKFQEAIQEMAFFPCWMIRYMTHNLVGHFNSLPEAWVTFWLAHSGAAKKRNQVTLPSRKERKCSVLFNLLLPEAETSGWEFERPMRAPPAWFLTYKRNLTNGAIRRIYVQT